MNFPVHESGNKAIHRLVVQENQGNKCRGFVPTDGCKNVILTRKAFEMDYSFPLAVWTMERYNKVEVIGYKRTCHFTRISFSAYDQPHCFTHVLLSGFHISYFIVLCKMSACLSTQRQSLQACRVQRVQPSSTICKIPLAFGPWPGPFL